MSLDEQIRGSRRPKDREEEPRRSRSVREQDPEASPEDVADARHRPVKPVTVGDPVAIFKATGQACYFQEKDGGEGGMLPLPEEVRTLLFLLAYSILESNDVEVLKATANDLERAGFPEHAKRARSIITGILEAER